MTLNNVNEGQTIAMGAIATIREDDVAGTVVATFTATDIDGDGLSYELTGADADDFTIVGNEIRLAASNPDYSDGATRSFTLEATDGSITTTENVVVSIEDVENTISGNLFSQTLTGDNERNRINAEGGSDTLYGLGGDDRLFGGSGNDTLVGGAGDDLYDGGSGTDTADFSALSTAVSVDLSVATAQDTGDGSDTFT